MTDARRRFGDLRSSARKWRVRISRHGNDSLYDAAVPEAGRRQNE
ncbi:hypothetical protein CSB92_2980 [Pseudomonas aeruginosa]|nr:hypothetical protein CSB97_5619 [Pseudomonas aeruginosa]SMZ48512.1 hypothetical protein PANN_06830 [Pseudomonas aeruginosa C-NN2]AVK20841.1 hypothetical protein CSB90_6421 [Pseudomonas aeruginosa]AVK24345.1 hypothetical protein CSB85_6042 [Pseudomonas aeruginosa]AWE70687.1 hypothetical protein CSC32_0710 [Pseudomonas aeruginosa]